MDHSEEPRLIHETNGTVWPPPPITYDTPSATPVFRLITGRGFLIAQKMNVAAAVCVIGTGFWDAVKPSDAATAAFGFAALFDFCTLFTAGYLFLRYIYQSYRSVNDLGAAGLPYTSGWAVGWFFVPIMNLYIPLRIVQTIWRASAVIHSIDNEFAWQANKNSLLINVWWGSYILWNFSATFLNVLSKSDGTTARALGQYAGNALIGLVPSILAIYMVQAIRKRQEQSARTLGLTIQVEPRRNIS